MHFRNFVYLILIAVCCGNLNAQTEQYNELMEQDWPNLKKYREANEKIHADSIYPKVVFMGNSITEGWVNMRPDFFSEHNFIGRGIGGQTTPQMLIRFMPDVIDLQPEVVVILAGINDIAGNNGYSSQKMITDNIKAMATLASENNIKVILSSVLPAYDFPWRPGLEPAGKVVELNKWIKNFAEKNNYTYLNYFDSTVDDRLGLKAEFSGDGVHPNALGYAVMEPLVLEAIEKVLNE
ncbi:SGNH/GDSL hydrolase family protein [Gramella sp. AN32]|uniref:SGNH/GDSL hydrolase family protein n=1 Tax=Christiangramia antarctica TaxID=2058158 RepID=A0ABW5X6U9_9FLAO|nr:SGNH/GDSL hydrolase family protein [Gramella sp. AN32]MCM4157793.1 acylhydrolase [Gramella sp. AN32]